MRAGEKSFCLVLYTRDVIGALAHRLDGRVSGTLCLLLRADYHADKCATAYVSEHTATTTKERLMAISTIVLILLVLVLIGAFPSWPHSRSWGYGPSGALGLIVVIFLVLLLMGRI